LRRSGKARKRRSGRRRADLSGLFSIHPHGFFGEVIALPTDSISEPFLPGRSSLSGEFLGDLVVSERKKGRKGRKEGEKRSARLDFLPSTSFLRSSTLYVDSLDLPLSERMKPLPFGEHLPLGLDSSSKEKRRRRREASTSDRGGGGRRGGREERGGTPGERGASRCWAS